MDTEPRRIRAALLSPDPSLPEIAVHVDRTTVVKRRWRAPAEDGTDFACELEQPLRDGDTLWQSATARYILRQIPENVLEIPLDLAPSAAAGIGWAIGNLHLELAAEPTRLLAPDEPAMRALLDRLQVQYRATIAVFRPGRFARGVQQSHELGTSHRH